MLKKTPKTHITQNLEMSISSKIHLKNIIKQTRHYGLHTTILYHIFNKQGGLYISREQYIIRRPKAKLAYGF